MPISSSNDLQHHEQQALRDLLQSVIQEQRRQRRWKIFFRLIYLFIFFMIIGLIAAGMGGSNNSDKPHTALITLRGELMDQGDANAENINKSLDAAFKDKNTKAVMLEINSPGGSPVQAGEIYNNLIRLEKAHPKIKVYAVCTDVCASGAYYVAAAANDIYADKASLVGSIGVLMDGFGFVDSLQKVGVQRRLLTSGSEKGFLDPFSPVKPADQAYMQTMLNIIHDQFITAVKTGRGTRLGNDPLLFSGLVWTGQQAKGLGLIDGIATPDEVVRNIIKVKTVLDYTVEDHMFNKFASHIGTQMVNKTLSLLGIQSSQIR